MTSICAETSRSSINGDITQSQRGKGSFYHYYTKIDSVEEDPSCYPIPRRHYTSW
ncbi:hypothetical protein Glove_155g98 [Diversispora epigaea]|uniref:Uncharacterized protein n=1 Tax=Diversispora epigaea TaxID=1348612 RepID=A0A397J0Q4_9GLOM|nr:hypothetical protein Glove_155g98 [Diversispora epigaea]